MLNWSSIKPNNICSIHNVSLSNTIQGKIGETIEETIEKNRRSSRKKSKKQLKKIDDILDCRFRLDCHPNNRLSKFGLPIVQIWIDWIGLDWQPCLRERYTKASSFQKSEYWFKIY